MNTTDTTTFDPVLALLADAMELVAAAREEYAMLRWDEEIDARVVALLREAVPDQASFDHLRENGIGPVQSAGGAR